MQMFVSPFVYERYQEIPMEELDPILEDLPPDIRAAMEREASQRGVTPSDYLAEIISQDLGRRQAKLRDEAAGYRFANDGDFDLQTLKIWLAQR